MKKNRFEKYLFDKKIKTFLSFKKLFNTHYGSIEEDDNLIAIHTGGWSENEDLIYEFSQTIWWLKNHIITERGGHYYFNINSQEEKKWKIVKSRT